MIDYQNSEKLNQNIHGFRAIQQFLEYLDSEGIRIVRRNKSVPYVELCELTDDEKLKLIYSFFEINPVKLEEERRLMLEGCQ